MTPSQSFRSADPVYQTLMWGILGIMLGWMFKEAFQAVGHWIADILMVFRKAKIRRGCKDD